MEFMETFFKEYLNVQSGLIALAVYVLFVIAWWRIFEKAGEAGWKALIPLYNLYVLCRIVEGSGWFFFLLLVPIADVIYAVLLNLRLAKAFGKGLGFGLGLLLLGPIFLLILAFGGAAYLGPRQRD